MSQPIIDLKKHRQENESLKADNRQKDMNLSRDYVTEWRTYIAEPLAIAFLCRDSAMSESELSPLRSLLKVDFVDLCRDSAKIESKLSSLLSLLPLLTCVLIGLSALCWTSWLNRRLVRALGIAIASVALLSLTTSCGSSRKATSSLQLTAYGLHETRDTVREQVMVAVHDTIREVTTITVQLGDAGD